MQSISARNRLGKRELFIDYSLSIIQMETGSFEGPFQIVLHCKIYSLR